MLVDDKAVSTELVLALSSAFTADAKLTTPTVARATVHFSTFIVPPIISSFVFRSNYAFGGQNRSAPAPGTGAIRGIFMDMRSQWQHLFLGDFRQRLAKRCIG